MKRVTATVTRLAVGWKAEVRVDGEFYARIDGPSYMTVAGQAMGYMVSLSDEAESTGGQK